MRVGGDEKAARRCSTEKFVRDVLFSNLPLPVLKFRTYLWLVIFSRAFGPTGYGAWALFLVTLDIGTHLASMTLGNSMMRFLSGERTQEEENRAFSSVLLAVLVSSASLGIILLSFSRPLAGWIFRAPEYQVLVLILAPTLIFDVMFEEMRGLLRARRRNRAWAFFTLARVIPETAATVVVAWVFHSVLATASVYLAGSILAAGCGLLYLIGSQNYRMRRPSQAVLTGYVPYGLALVPGAIASALSFSADKYLVGYYVGVHAVGIYSVCFTVSALGFFFVGPINDVLLPEISALWDGGDRERFYRRFSGVQKFVFGFAAGATALLVVFPETIVRLLTSQAYSSGGHTLAILGFQGVFMSVVMLYVVLLYVRLRTITTSLLWMGMGMVIVVADILLLPRIGIAGAGYSQLLSSVVGAAVVVGLNWNIFRHTFPLRWFLQAGLAFAAVYCMGMAWPDVPAGLFQGVARLGAGSFLFLLLLVFTGYVTRGDVNLLKQATLG